MLRSTLFVFLLSPALLAQTARGVLRNGTTGGAGHADVVQVIDLSKGFTPVKTLTDVTGAFAIELDELDEGAQYLIQARVGATSYSDRWSPDGDSPVELTVFDESPDVKVDDSLGSFAVFAYEDKVDIGLFYNLDNRSDPPMVLNSESPTYSYKLIPGYSNIDVSTKYGDNLPLRTQAPESGSQGQLQYPLKPGRTQLMVTTTYSYDRQHGFSADIPVLPEQPGLNILVLPASLEIAGENIQLVERDPNQNMALYQWVRGASGSAPTIHVTGEPAASRGMQGTREEPSTQARTSNAPERVPDPMSHYRWWVIGGVFVLLTLIAFWGARRAN